MSTVEEMLKKAIEEKNEERKEMVAKKIKALVNNIVDWEADIADLKEKIKQAKASIKELDLPEKVSVEL